MNYLYFFLFFAIVIDSTFGKSVVPKIQSKRDFSGRIIGGQPANTGQFPSAAAIYVGTNDGTYFCGGSLIGQQWVLTAAHCIQSGIIFTVILGSNTLQGTDPNRRTFSTSTYVLHPEFDPETLQNDIGLIKFHLPVEYNDFIKRAYLPSTDLIDNMASTAVGWGSISDTSASVSNELNYVSVISIPNSECQLSYANQIFDTMVCVAGNYNEGTCRGDSGSALLTTVSFLHWVVGVASFISTSGCESTDPSGYTRIYPFVEWIKTTAEIP